MSISNDLLQSLEHLSAPQLRTSNAILEGQNFYQLTCSLSIYCIDSY